MHKLYDQDLGDGWQLRHVFALRHVITSPLLASQPWWIERLSIRQPANRRMQPRYFSTDRGSRRSVVATRTVAYADPDVLLWMGPFEAYARITDSDQIPLAAQLLGTVWSLPGPTGLIRVLGFEAKLELAREVGGVPDVDR